MGSSAKTTVGRLTSARAMATRCCSPAESSDGRCLRRSSRPTLPRRASKKPASGFVPASESGKRMFSSARQHRQQLRNWKMKRCALRRSSVTSVSLSSPRRVSAIVKRGHDEAAVRLCGIGGGRSDLGHADSEASDLRRACLGGQPYFHWSPATKSWMRAPIAAVSARSYPTRTRMPTPRCSSPGRRSPRERVGKTRWSGATGRHSNCLRISTW